MYSEVFSTTIFGLSAHIVTVESDVSMGLPVFEMSGYLTSEVKEARERIKVAIRNSGEEIRPQKMIVNISPADLRKDGTGFDLPIAVGLLCANGIIVSDKLKKTVIIGELSLDGSVNGVNGVLPCVCEARQQGYTKCIVPATNAEEAALVEDIEVIGIHTLRELIDYLNGDLELTAMKHNDYRKEIISNRECSVDFNEIRGQEAAKRATLIAVAGMHNIMYVGAPGSGKTMLAKRIPTIMPSLTFQESLELTKISSIAGILEHDNAFVTQRPFRSPHHNVTSSALLGGGRIPKPGEITLAGKGVLFLDEMTEYRTAVIEALRQPLEEKKITISRLNYVYSYPADFMLAAAINPCKCGYYPDRNKCNCSEYDIRRYIGRISSPIWDRFDISIRVETPKYEDMIDQPDTDQDSYCSDRMKDRVEQVRKIQLERFADSDISFNSEMSASEIKRYCKLGDTEQNLMQKVYDKLNLTGRGYHKILKTARTIADLDGSKDIKIAHLSEAVSYRSYDTAISLQHIRG